MLSLIGVDAMPDYGYYRAKLAQEQTVIAHRGEHVTVQSSVQSQAMADGACLPGPEAIIAGPDFATWLAAQD